jgi:hypothetical protein
MSEFFNSHACSRQLSYRSLTALPACQILMELLVTCARIL